MQHVKQATTIFGLLPLMLSICFYYNLSYNFTAVNICEQVVGTITAKNWLTVYLHLK